MSSQIDSFWPSALTWGPLEHAPENPYCITSPFEGASQLHLKPKLSPTQAQNPSKIDPHTPSIAINTKVWFLQHPPCEMLIFACPEGRKIHQKSFWKHKKIYCEVNNQKRYQNLWKNLPERPPEPSENLPKRSPEPSQNAVKQEPSQRNSFWPQDVSKILQKWA